MSIKDELKELARTTLEKKYAKQLEYDKTLKRIKSDLEKAVRIELQEVSIYFASWGYDDFCPSASTIKEVMREIDLPYEDAYGNDSYGVSIDLSEVYENV